MWNPNLATFSQSDVAIPSKMDMLELYHVMKLQDFLSSSEFRIENKSKVDEINIEVRNRTELDLVGWESKVYRIEKFGNRPSFNLNPFKLNLKVSSKTYKNI